MSLRMRASSSRRSRAKWRARLVFSVVGSSGREVAVVSQRPGREGSVGVGVGRVEVEVGMGICRERLRVGERRIWAMCDLEMLVWRVEIALARVDCERI